MNTVPIPRPRDGFTIERVVPSPGHRGASCVHTDPDHRGTCIAAPHRPKLVTR